ncbi:MAG: 2-C-methyl-D-erythritol 4-phosphate cytidylyltransferase [Lachnospiraceae bacterium]|nr:2-C-methyl-D-erythritol 4-phosphate cytidylyltransferase [Lachnospiraceae bacterium]
MKRTVAIIVAAGAGRRMNSSVKKQYIEIKSHPVLYYTLKAFEDSAVDGILLVTGADEIDYVSQEIVEKYAFKKVLAVIPGGKERYDSVFCGMKYLSDTTDVEYATGDASNNSADKEIKSEGLNVLVHDGVRLLVSPELINRVISETENKAACIAAVAVKDTIKTVDINDEITGTCERSMLRQVQTPQGFDYALLMGAYKSMYAAIGQRPELAKTITDDAMLVEQFTEHPVYCVTGDYRNIKITTPEDILMAEAFL